MSIRLATRPSQVPSGSSDAPMVSLHNVTKVFGSGDNATVALESFNLEVAPGELVAIVGASGCGKTTLLNLIAGLDQPTSGTVTVRDPRPALMFQEAALFPWLSAQRNVELALQLQGVGKAERRERAGELLELVRLSSAATKRPHEMSGGMRQRVALARALAQGAQVLLMDEPFGALDAITRDVLHEELERIWLQVGCSIIFVTHNVREAVRLGDRIVVLTSRPGRVADEFIVDVPRPRPVGNAALATARGEIVESLRAEVRRHGRAHA